MPARSSEFRYPIPQTGESTRADQASLFWKVLRYSAPIKGDKERSAQLIGAEKCRAFWNKVREIQSKVIITIVQKSSEAKGEREDLSLGIHFLKGRSQLTL